MGRVGTAHEHRRIAHHTPVWLAGLAALARALAVTRAAALLILAVVTLSARQARAADDTVHITRVEPYASRDAARVVLYASEPVSFERGGGDSAAATRRLYVDLPRAVYSGVPSFELRGLLRRVRMEPADGKVRVLLELSEPAQHSVFFLPQPFRVVIDVARSGAGSQKVQARVRQRVPAASHSERAVRRIALDPGHGGSETGATGPRGIREKDIVLDIAHRAAPLLARELGISTLLTRDTDDRVPLEERVAKANAFGADLFLSIHCNADPSRTARGVISFVLDGSHDRHSVPLLERENAAPSTGVEFQRFLEQFDDRIASGHSHTFARLLQRSALASLQPGYPDVIDGGVRGAGFYVLAGARMPAVLFESSFISNELEGTRLGTARYRQKLADAIVNAVRAYKAGY